MLCFRKTDRGCRCTWQVWQFDPWRRCSTWSVRLLSILGSRRILVCCWGRITDGFVGPIAFVLSSKPESMADFFICPLVIHLFPSIISCALDPLQESCPGPFGFLDDIANDPRLLVPARLLIHLFVLVYQDMKLMITMMIQNMQTTATENVLWPSYKSVWLSALSKAVVDRWVFTFLNTNAILFFLICWHITLVWAVRSLWVWTSAFGFIQWLDSIVQFGRCRTRNGD